MHLPDFIIIDVIPGIIIFLVLYQYTKGSIAKIKKLKRKRVLAEAADNEFIKYIDLKRKFSKDQGWPDISLEQRKNCLDSLLAYLENGDIDGKVSDYWQRLSFFLESRIGHEDFYSYDMRVKKVLKLA